MSAENDAFSESSVNLAVTAEKLPVAVQCSSFLGADGVVEIHWMIRPTQYACFETQLEWVRRAYEAAVEALGMTMNTAVWRRFLCSDLLNQREYLEKQPFAVPDDQPNRCAVSWVCQPPMAPSKVTLWAEHVYDPTDALSKNKNGNTLSLYRGDLVHHWTTGITTPDVEGSYSQTMGIFGQYDEVLKRNKLTLEGNVVRTWFFLQNVDANYHGLVEARNAVFDESGLTADTHYIASTGIEGGSHEVSARTMMDAYAISGVKPEQVSHLQARDYLCPTHEYGVAFERGTTIAYRDRKHIFISGTASIDSHGEIVSPGNVFQQLERTLLNIEALLKEADAKMRDMQIMLVYLRDPNDHVPIYAELEKRFPKTPFEIVTAPVCRPGWLIEIEGLAIVENDAHELPPF